MKKITIVKRSAISAIILVSMIISAFTVAPAVSASGPITDPVMVKDIHPYGGSTPSWLTAMGDTLFFQAYDDTHGYELWKSDGTEVGTVIVKDIWPGTEYSWPCYLTVVASTLFFSADDGTHGTELWKSDGTEAGTAMVKDISPGIYTADVYYLTVVGDEVFFVATNSTNGYELWKSDGTEAGTVMVKDINPGSGGSYPYSLVVMGGTLFFNADDGTNGAELWKSDGTEAGTVMVKDIYLGSASSSPDFLRVMGGALFFTAYDASNGGELWKSDGTEVGTALVKDINPGAGNSWPYYLTAMGSELFFVANNGTAGDELWKSDGTEAGTVMVKDIYSGAASSGPDFLTVMGSALFFTAYDPDHYWELWKSDGTEAGTVMVKDINPIADSYPSYTAAISGTLFFGADDGTNGAELWKSDGTEAGTVMVKDINPGSGYGDPGSFTLVGATVFFVANDGTNGYELWKMEAPPVDPIVNGSFETGDYTGWTLSESLVPFYPAEPEDGTFGIAQDGQTINLYDIAYDYSDGLNVTQSSYNLPITYNATDGDYLAYILTNSEEVLRMYQDIALDALATNVTWDMWYENASPEGFDPKRQYLAVYLRDTDDNILETLFKTTEGVDPYSINMSSFSFNISAYAGTTVRFDIEEGFRWDYSFDSAFDNFEITGGTNYFVNGSFETGDYTGWTLLEYHANIPYPDAGTFGIAEDGQTINYGESTYDYADEADVYQDSYNLPMSYNTTDGDYLAYILTNYEETLRMYQDIALDAGATNVTWDMWYKNALPEGFDPYQQYLAVYLRDTDDNILETLFKTTEGVDPYAINMTSFSFNISAYAGTTVRFDIEQSLWQNYSFDSAFDNFAIMGGTNYFVNGSFETGNYTGWTLLEFYPSTPTPYDGTFGIAEDGQTISYGDSTWDFHDGLNVTQRSEGLPITYQATDGNHLAYILVNGPETLRMYQDITVSPNATVLTWDMSYTNWADEFDPDYQFLAVSIRNPLDDSIIETLFKTTEGVNPDIIPMTKFSRDISAYAGTTVRLDITQCQYNFYFESAFDNFAMRAPIVGDRLFMVDGNNSTIYELDPSTGAVVNSFTTPISTDGGGDGLAYGNGRMFFTTIGTNIIYEIDPSDGSIVNQLEPLPKVAVYGAQADSYNADVQAKLISTGLFSQVDVFSLNESSVLPTPTLTELQEYDAVLVYSDYDFADNDAMGDVLADYIDVGGGVVLATFAFYDPVYGLGVGGRISSGGYLPFTQNMTEGGGVNLTLVPNEPEHPILSGVTSFSGGSSSFFNTVNLTMDAYLVAHWSNDVPLIAVKEPMGEGAGWVVGLNFFPVSSDARSDYWDSSTDGALLMANSLLFASSAGEADIDALGFSGDALYALQYGDNATIRVLNPDTGGTITILRPGIPLVGGLTFAGSRDSLFVSNSGGEPAPSFGMTNQGFEAGSFTGWDVNEGFYGNASVEMSWESSNGSIYEPYMGNYFALLQNGDAGEDTCISQNFTLDAGESIEGWAFFSTAEDYGQEIYNDECSVDIMDGATLVERVFFADTWDVNWPDTPWTYWSWEAPSAGNYTLLARVVNIGDRDVSSYMGFDIAETIPPTVYEINPETGAVLNSFPAPVALDYGLYGLGFSSSRNTLFLGFYESNMIYEVDPDTGDVINSFVGPEGSGISALAADECGAAPSAPEADFHASEITICAGVEIYFFDDSRGTYDTWYWDFGDGSNSTEENPSHAYAIAGNYTVSLTVSDGYGDDTESKSDYITVLPSPEASFHANIIMACAGVTFNFTDDSTGTYDSWYWDFGDGSNSTDQNPSHIYVGAGNYTVSLNVSNCCCQDTETKIDYITVLPQPEAGFHAGNTTVCAGVAINFTDDSTGILDTWYWDFGDGSNSTDQNPSHAYSSAGNYTVLLHVSNPWCEDEETKADYITVLPLPEADFHASDTSPSANVTINFFDDSTGTYDSWYWDFGDGSNSTAQNPSHNYTSVGNYTVSLTISNGCGDDTETKADYIEVAPLSEANTVTVEAEAEGSPLAVPVHWSWDSNSSTNTTSFGIGSIPDGTGLSLTAPATHTEDYTFYVFDHWSVGGTDYDPGDVDITFEVNEDLTAIAHYTAVISVDKTLDRCDNGTISYPFDPNALPLKTLIYFGMTIRVDALADVIEDIRVEDGFGADLVVTAISGGSNHYMQYPGKGKKGGTKCVWELSDMDDGDWVSLGISAWTATNAKGKQQYASTGEHTLNSGPKVFFTYDGKDYMLQGPSITVNVVG